MAIYFTGNQALFFNILFTLLMSLSTSIIEDAKKYEINSCSRLREITGTQRMIGFVLKFRSDVHAAAFVCPSSMVFPEDKA